MPTAPACIAVTGATGGIGSALVTRLTDAGHPVVLLDLNPAVVAEHVSAHEAAGHQVVGYGVDTTDEKGMARAFEEAEARLGPLGGLVTAAAVDHPQVAAVDVDLELWEQVQRVNVLGTFVAARGAARRMTGRGGSIVTIGSVSAVTARAGKVPYCTSKAAILGLTRSLALELAPVGIRVNAVCPGPTDTAMVREAVAQGGPSILDARLRGSLEEFRPGIPMGRLAEPEEQAAVIQFVLLEATFMSGSVVFSDGGLTVV